MFCSVLVNELDSSWRIVNAQLRAVAVWMRSFKLSQCERAASSCRSVNAQLQAVAVWTRSFKLSQGECAGYRCPADVGSGKRTQSFRLNENLTWSGGAVYFLLILLRHLHFSSPLLWLPGNDVGWKIWCIIQNKCTVLESFGVLSCHCYLPGDYEPSKKGLRQGKCGYLYIIIHTENSYMYLS